MELFSILKETLILLASNLTLQHLQRSPFKSNNTCLPSWKSLFFICWPIRLKRILSLSEYPCFMGRNRMICFDQYSNRFLINSIQNGSNRHSFQLSQNPSFQCGECLSLKSCHYKMEDYTFSSRLEIKCGVIIITRQFNQLIQYQSPMNQFCQVISQASHESEPSCPTEDTPSACSFEKVKPWFFKPRKSKFGFEDGAKKVKKYNCLHWSQEENRKYVQFLKGFLELVNGDILQKRKYHLNRMLSKHIGSRSPIQCRSHHQKMIKAYGTPSAIISHFETPNIPNEVTSNENGGSSTPREVEHSSLHQQQSVGTHGETRLCLEVQKLKEFDEYAHQMQEEAMLWDVLTYPLMDDSFNDL